MASPVPGGIGATAGVLTELVPEVVVEATSGGVVVESAERFVVVPDAGTVVVVVESAERFVVVPDAGTVVAKTV